jgi:hypothetical protein
MTERLDQQARMRAMQRVVAEFPRKFKKYLNEERAALGLPPVGTTRVGPKPKVKS